MEKNKHTRKIVHRTICILLCLALLGGIAVLGINGYVKSSTADQILSPEAATKLTGIDCILVLGCYVHDSGRPSDMLADRLSRGIELYQSGAAPKLLMSGDHGQKDYNEVKAMKLEALEEGIPSEDIFMDHSARWHTGGKMAGSFWRHTLVFCTRTRCRNRPLCCGSS